VRFPLLLLAFVLGGAPLTACLGRPDLEAPNPPGDGDGDIAPDAGGPPPTDAGPAVDSGALDADAGPGTGDGDGDGDGDGMCQPAFTPCGGAALVCCEGTFCIDNLCRYPSGSDLDGPFDPAGAPPSPGIIPTVHFGDDNVRLAGHYGSHVIYEIATPGFPHAAIVDLATGGIAPVAGSQGIAENVDASTSGGVVAWGSYLGCVVRGVLEGETLLGFIPGCERPLVCKDGGTIVYEVFEPTLSGWRTYAAAVEVSEGLDSLTTAAARLLEVEAPPMGCSADGRHVYVHGRDLAENEEGQPEALYDCDRGPRAADGSFPGDVVCTELSSAAGPLPWASHCAADAPVCTTVDNVPPQSALRVTVHDGRGVPDRLASVATWGGFTGGPGFSDASVSADGRYVAFVGRSEGERMLDRAPGSERQHCWVHDRVTGATVLAATSSTGERPDAGCHQVRIDPEGRTLALVSSSTNIDGHPEALDGDLGLFVVDNPLLAPSPPVGSCDALARTCDDGELTFCRGAERVTRPCGGGCAVTEGVPQCQSPADRYHFTFTFEGTNAVTGVGDDVLVRLSAPETDLTVRFEDPLFASIRLCPLDAPTCGLGSAYCALVTTGGGSTWRTDTPCRFNAGEATLVITPASPLTGSQLVEVVVEPTPRCAPDALACLGADVARCLAPGDRLPETPLFACADGCRGYPGTESGCAHVDEQPEPPDPTAPQALGVVAGYLPVESALQGFPDEDWLTFTVAEASAVRVRKENSRLVPDNGSAYVSYELYREGALIDEGDLTEDASSLPWVWPAGAYQLRLHNDGHGVTGVYRAGPLVQPPVCAPSGGSCEGEDLLACNAIGTAARLLSCQKPCQSAPLGDDCGWTTEVEPNDSWQTQSTDLGTLGTPGTERAIAEGRIDSLDPIRDVDSFRFTAAVGGRLTLTGRPSLLETAPVPIQITLFNLDAPALVPTEPLAPPTADRPHLAADVIGGTTYAVVVEHPQSGVFDAGRYWLQLDLAFD
jgi:hypothetical protein